MLALHYFHYPIHLNKILNNDTFIETLKKHLLVPINDDDDTNNVFYKIEALKCLANLCSISIEFSNHFINIVENICFVDDKNNNNTEVIKKSLLALKRLIAVNNDYVINIEDYKASITSLLTNTNYNYGVTNCALCLFNTMLKNRFTVKQKQIEIIVKGFLGEIDMNNYNNNNYVIMAQIPNNVISILCNYYTETCSEFIEIIVNKLHSLVIDNQCPQSYKYYLTITMDTD